MPAVLVTGGAGYIGSHTAKALARAGERVIIYDNLSAGHRAAALGAELVEGDVRDGERLRDVLRRFEVSAVLHFAAWLSVADSVHDPVGYYHNNVVGALTVLDAMRASGVGRFIFSSTCATYGEPRDVPLIETMPPAPINAYGETKLAVERALPHFERAYGIRWISLRYFNAAGADPEGELGEAHHPEIHLIPRALDAATGGEGLTVFGTDYPTPDGTCLRDYIHVTDLADAHVRALWRLEAGGGSGVYNLGTERPASVREVIETVQRVTGRPVPHAIGPRRAGDPAVLYASSVKARADLGWHPQRPELATLVDDAWRWWQAPRFGGRVR